MSTYDRVIRHPAALGSLSVLPLMQPRPRGRIRIDDTRLDAETRAGWERQLNHAYRACGCGEGSLGGMVGIVVGVLLAASGWLDVAFVSGSTAGLVLGATFIGGAVGKIVGLLRAQGRLNALVTRIRAEWRSEPAHYTDTNCG